MANLFISLRLTLATLLICVVGYTSLLWAFGRIAASATAQGSLLYGQDGKIVGSRLLAQPFTKPHYFWPRPSAVAYNASAAGGSNKSPTNPDLAVRARETAAQYGASTANPLPADLAAASGGGLDPHITLRAALYQVPRVASARNWPSARVESITQAISFRPGGAMTPERLVNVLELNLALDRETD